MKQLVFFLMMACLCSCTSQHRNESVLQIDVSHDYSTVRMNLQDFAEVEYIRLANDSGFLVRSRPLVCSANYIITKGGEPGEILLFDKEGKPVSKFSHYGNGPHEYNYITNLRIDEKRGEIYIHDVFSQKIFIYTLKGEFIREFPSGDARFIYNFDDDSFLVYNTETNQINPELKPYFSIVSKMDGKILKRIHVPFSSGKKYDLTVTKEGAGGSFSYTAMHLPIVRYADGYFLNELSSDTIYKYSYKGDLVPFITRTPEVSTMDAPSFLQSGIETSKYVFLTRVAVNENDEQNMFPEENWVYDKETGGLHAYEIVNEDYPKAGVVLNSHLVNCDMEPGYGISRFNAGELLDAYSRGELYGGLKEIAALLEEEDNDVLVLYKFR